MEKRNRPLLNRRNAEKLCHWLCDEAFIAWRRYTDDAGLARLQNVPELIFQVRIADALQKRIARRRFGLKVALGKRLIENRDGAPACFCDVVLWNGVQTVAAVEVKRQWDRAALLRDVERLRRYVNEVNAPIACLLFSGRLQAEGRPQ